MVPFDGLDHAGKPTQHTPRLFFAWRILPCVLQEKGGQARLTPNLLFTLVASYSLVAGDDDPITFRRKLTQPYAVTWIALGIPATGMVKLMIEKAEDFTDSTGQVRRLRTIEIELHAARRAEAS